MRIVAPGNGRGQDPLETREGVVHVVTSDNQIVDRTNIDRLPSLHIGNPAGHE